jgi:hypothetical protein
MSYNTQVEEEREKKEVVSTSKKDLSVACILEPLL